MFRLMRTSCAVFAIHAAGGAAALAQSTNLPPIIVTDTAERRGETAPAGDAQPQTQPRPGTGSLTAPNTEQARREVNTPRGAVAIVPAEAFKDQRATTVKDMLDFVPGV